MNRNWLIVVSVLAGLFFLQNACQMGGAAGWLYRGWHDENYTVLRNVNGVPVVPPDQPVGIQRGNQIYEVPAERSNPGWIPSGLQPVGPAYHPGTTAPPPPQPAPQCGTPQVPCGPDEGYQPLVPR
ncbi:MAG TPA: hypothetical protein VD862_02995 [Candidatus Paceibacterota bacterium]|nr:hypothetical protein [Candidatus Paceibacterota bacterium]